jgi:hypothetical protein
MMEIDGSKPVNLATAQRRNELSHSYRFGRRDVHATVLKVLVRAIAASKL